VYQYTQIFESGMILTIAADAGFGPYMPKVRI